MLPGVLTRNIRAIVTKLITVKRWRSLSTRKGRQIVNVEGREYTHLQEWGFFGKAPAGGGETICVYPRGSADHGYSVVVDGKGRPSFDEGECGLFNSEGVVIRLKGKKVIIEGADDVEIEADTKITGDLKVEEGTTIEFNGIAVDQLVRKLVLDIIAVHTHPIGVDPITQLPVAMVSTDELMTTLSTNPANYTTFMKG